MKKWSVALAGLLCLLGPGALYSFSLISTPLVAAFGWTASSVTWGFALANLSLAIGAFCGGLIADRFGPRYVAMSGVLLWATGYGLCGTLASQPSIALFYLYYGVIGGFGCGIAYISAIGAAIRWFPERRGFGGGLIVMGFGLGSFVYNSVVRSSDGFAAISAHATAFSSAQAQALRSHTTFDGPRYMFDPQTTAQLMALFTISAIVFAIVGVIAAVFLAHPPTDDALAEQPQYSLRRTLGDARFYVVWAILFLNIFGGVTMISNMVPLMREIAGLDAATAAGIYGFLAIFNGVGRVAIGTIADRIGSRLTFAIIFAGQAGAFFALDSTRDPRFVSIAIGVLLFCYGGGFGAMPAFNADYFGTKHFGANYGAQLSAWGLAAVVGTYFISTMKNVSGSFSGLMQPVSIVVLVAIFFPLIIETPRRLRRVTNAPAT